MLYLDSIYYHSIWTLYYTTSLSGLFYIPLYLDSYTTSLSGPYNYTTSLSGLYNVLPLYLDSIYYLSIWTLLYLDSYATSLSGLYIILPLYLDSFVYLSIWTLILPLYLDPIIILPLYLDSIYYLSIWTLLYLDSYTTSLSGLYLPLYPDSIYSVLRSLFLLLVTSVIRKPPYLRPSVRHREVFP